MSLSYALRRLWQTVPMLLGVIVVGFSLIHLAPGDPVIALGGESGDAAYYAEMRERFGLDEPFLTQLWTYLSRIAQGDLGQSAIQNRPVLDVIWSRIPNTLMLAGSALFLSTTIGIVTGVFTAVRSGTFRSFLVSTSTLIIYAVPVFWVGQLAVLWLGLRLGWFPVQGRTSPRSSATGAAHVVDVLYHLALPSMVLATQQLALVARLTRASLSDQLNELYIDAARAKGLSYRRVVLTHALPASLLPVVTVVGNRLGHLVSGAVVVEIVFGWPGIGRLLVTSTTDRDIPVLLGLFLLVGFAVLIANLLTDYATARLDPRIQIR